MNTIQSRGSTLTVHLGEHRLEGLLTFPNETAKDLVIFAHGSGSSRLSPRNTYVADMLNARGMATLLFDLLTETEALDRSNVFDIPLLGRRVAEAVQWAQYDDTVGNLAIGLFGASTGAAAALIAAAESPGRIAAVVSRGGRPDLAGPVLGRVDSPTLLLVGGLDSVVIQLNQEAFNALTCEKRLMIVPGATHLFEEPGTMDQVIAAAGDWFETYLPRGAP